MNLDKKPLPRFWYFPNGKKAVVIMTGDDHGNGGTAPRFDQFVALSKPGCNVANWECIRGTSYIFVEPGNLSNAQAVAYTAAGFEVGLHINTNCADFTPTSLESFYVQQTADFHSNYPGIPAPITQRHHCIAWSDWVSGAQTELNHNIRLDTSYYFWPPGWVGNQPGNFTGSAMPMRFTDLSGKIVDVYQATSQMTDESGQAYPFTIDTLLDRALGAEGYYGAYTINAHTDVPQTQEATAVVSSAQARGVPVVSSVQMLTWLDGRNNSSFGNLSWNGNTLHFTVSPGAGSHGLQVMLPTQSVAGVLVGLTGPSGAVTYIIDDIKGVDYAFFPVATGAYVATYGADTQPPTVLSTSPAKSATGVNPLISVTSAFSKDMKATTINAANFELRDSANVLIPATIAYIESNDQATLTPAAPLAVQSTYTAKIKGGATGVTDIVGNALASDYTWSFTTGTFSSSVWGNSTTPGTLSANDAGSVDLGVKFKVDVAGSITGLRFYKGAGNTGTHIGNLWDANGTKLATATFANETASGWQQVNFTTPVAITAGTVYVASYLAPNGHYASDNLFFANAGADNAPVHMLQNGVNGGNGVYVYSAGSAFPTQSYLSTNYWVDVVFAARIGPAPLTVVSTTPANSATGINPGINNSKVTINVSFNNTLNPATVTGSTFTLQDAKNVSIPASVSVNVNSATLIASSALNPLSVYKVSLTTGIKDINGNSLAANYSWSFTTGSGASCTSNCSIWPATTTPTLVDSGPDGPVELGVKFKSDVNGIITGIRFYKAGLNTGTHIGSLWSSTGVLLTSASFISETASGWQQVNFTTPVPVTANTVYVASYHTNVGHYSDNLNYFASTGIDNPPLHALANGVSVNGVYAYGANSTFPNQTWSTSNYWVDVVFNPSTAPTNLTIWPGTTVPRVVDAGPDSAVELGVKFKSDVNGTITGIRFYKASTNTGTHVGNLWSSAGALLASATFNSETVSGWQQLTFSPPVPVTPNTVYVASYHTNAGHYSNNQKYFANTGADNLTLHALANNISPNGVFAYGATSIFPNQTWNTSNYWVDVVFN
jgi:hypothetical protein